ncbi:MAG TPA: hypothetical protein K8V97_02755 [Jeotgalicoccus aerolatus]|nr:hypothetical protein [Jeotgalicoccus aerolatus]
MSNQFRPLFLEPDAEDYLKAAKAAAEMFKNTAVKTTEGIYWEEEPFSPADPYDDTFMGQFSLYSGSPGVIYFLTQLTRATGDREYLSDAVEAGKYMISNWECNVRMQQYGGNIAHSEWGVLNGVSGIAFVFGELAAVSGLEEFNEFAVHLIEEVADAARQTDKGIVWTDEPAIFFDSGIILFLIHAAEKYDRKDWLKLALDAGEKVLNDGQEHDGKMTWPTISPAYFGIPEDSVMPNYFYGTAGVAYALAALYAENKDDRYLSAAVKGAKYIQSIATVENENILFPHSFPYLKDVRYLGLCHGAAGTVRLFYKLYQVTGEAEYKEWTEHIVNGILSTGAPELHSDGYWNVASQCCGSASMSSVFLGLWAETGDDKYLTYAKRVGKQLLSESVYDENTGACWYHAFDRTNPEHVTAKIGYLDGASGIAAELLQLYQADIGQFDVLRLPDDPYPKSI